MYRHFFFEEDIHTSLSCVPLAVRRKLDLAGLKISLSGWQTLPREERLALCHLPVDEEGDVCVYREILQGFAARSAVCLVPLGEGAVRREDWSSGSVVARLNDRLGSAAHAFSEKRIGELDEEARYALFKLADPKRDPEKLRAALGELEL